jgi:archaellum component FlaF (FlaF/FlaG flagellin family)
MYVVNRHFNNRAVNQVIAALLLIAIAVAAAILLYVFAIGLLGSLGSSGGQQTKEQLIMESYNWAFGSPPGSITLTVRNVGSASIDAGHTDIFVNGNLISGGLAGCLQVLTPTQSCTTSALTVPGGAGSYIAGAAYPLKLVTPDGGVFSYSVIAGGSS